VEAVDALDLGAPFLRDAREAVTDGDAADDQHAVVVDDLAGRLDLVALPLDVDLTRFQRAGEGAGQSAAGGGNDVVEGRRVRREVLRRDTVMLGDLGMDAEGDRLLFGGQVGEPLRASEALDAHARDVGRIGHARHPTAAGGTGGSDGHRRRGWRPGGGDPDSRVAAKTST
jgi:hypothetical protein